MRIVPMRDLKNTVEIEKQCVAENGPVYVTKNGYGRLVVMDMEYYEKMMRDIQEAKDVMAGLADLKMGKVEDGEAVMAELRSKYGI